MSDPVVNRIEEVIQSKPVAIFMKGSPDFPMCGFSGKTIEVLRASGVSDTDLASFDVLEDENVRSGIKQYTNWPTIPQVFVKGKFVGGCDIVSEMFEKGELKELVAGSKA